MKTNNLLKLVTDYFNEGYFDTRIRQLLKQTQFSDDEIDYLWDYVFKIQKRVLKGKAEALTMQTMKKEIGRLIGNPLSASGYAGSPVGKNDLYKIYQYITSLPEEYLKDRLNE